MFQRFITLFLQFPSFSVIVLSDLSSEREHHGTKTGRENMGRPYKQELSAIKETYEYIKGIDISAIIPFFQTNCNVPLLIIGSGGSYAVAKAFELVYQAYGGFAKAVTPYELKNERRVLGKVKVLIVSAGGNNPDTVGVYEYVRLYEPEEICIICMSKGSKIAQKALMNKDAILFEAEIPFGKDGYLAVNSSVAMFTIITKIMNQQKLSANRKPEFCDLSIKKKFIQESIQGKSNFIVLYGGWGTPAAYDFESKCSEAGLFSVQFVDYRNFSHGRHNWIDKNRDTTVIVALTTPDDILIRDKTLDKLPCDLPKICLETQNKGSLAALELLVQVFYFVDFLGELRGIDPGRPGVPDFGSKLYNIKYNLKSCDPYIKKVAKDRKETCIFRKMKYLQADQGWYEYYSDMYDRFLQKIYNERYSALVLDFDGTVMEKGEADVSEFIRKTFDELLCNDITVAFATGRGDSITGLLERAINQKYWNRVTIGYYNGSYIASLDDEVDFTNAHSETLENFMNQISTNRMIKDKIIYKGYQLSLREPDAGKRNFYFELLEEYRQNDKYKDIRIFKSGHAIDIIEENCGKQKVVDYIQKNTNAKVLCIGDEGSIWENDFELLSQNYGISSNHQNQLGISGWNLAPLGVSNVHATKYYFEKMKIQKGYFTLEE